MSATHCLNCKTPLHGKYCHGCGQKGAIHRISLKHFFAHDVVHGIWHLDGSLPRTLKGVMLRPGYMARDYLAGMRTGVFNILTLIILLFGLNWYTANKLYPDSDHRADVQFQAGWNSVEDNKKRTEREAAGDKREFNILRIIEANGKWLTLATIPLLSLASFLVLRRSRFNYAEHMVVNAFFLAGALLWSLLATVLIWLLEQLIHIPLADWDLSTFVILGVAYWQAFRTHYSLGGWLWRLLLVIILFVVFVIVVFVISYIVYKRLTT